MGFYAHKLEAFLHLQQIELMALFPSFYLGSVSAYGMLYINERPLTFEGAQGVSHNTYIDFDLLTWSITDGDTISMDKITTALQIKNGVKLQGIVENDVTLSADKFYVLTNSWILKG